MFKSFLQGRGFIWPWPILQGSLINVKVCFSDSINNTFQDLRLLASTYWCMKILYIKVHIFKTNKNACVVMLSISINIIQSIEKGRKCLTDTKAHTLQIITVELKSFCSIILEKSAIIITFAHIKIFWFIGKQERL